MTAYYNENNKFRVGWLRNLINDGRISSGKSTTGQLLTSKQLTLWDFGDATGSAESRMGLRP